MAKTRFTADLPPEIYVKMMDQAEKEGKSRNQIIQEALALYMDQIKKEVESKS